MSQPEEPPHAPAASQQSGDRLAKGTAAGSVPPEAIKAIPVRHYGRWIGAAVVLALLALLASAFINADINWNVVGEYLTYDTIIEGAGKTLWITVASMALGLVLGLILAVDLVRFRARHTGKGDSPVG